MGIENIIERAGIEVVATGVSEQEYMERYVGAGHEWENGEVIKLSPVTLRHFKVVQYSENLLEIYFALRPIGMVLGEPYVLKITPSSPRREPDLTVILKTNPGQLTETAFLGPANICIEVVSEGSEEHDYGKKFVEYQRGAVKEYWIFDSLREEHRFYRLDEAGIYRQQPLDADDNYQTPLLPGLKVHPATLWLDPLPNALEVGEMLKAMLG